jgi:hypothetical protein
LVWFVSAVVCLNCLRASEKLGVQAIGNAASDAHQLFASGAARHLQIEISPEGMETLREYHQVWGQPRPERIDVTATVREGATVYTNVAVHLKGSYTFQPVDGKPSLTLSFDKLASGQRFHGLSKIHLNNSVQDPSYLCEQLARQLFDSIGVPSPRATHALVTLNGRDLGLFVLVEAANKQFVKRYFESADGNLYDGGSGGDITRPLKAESGLNPEDRSDLLKLATAARQPDPTQRLMQLEQVLDVERFISFAAAEDFLVHWDGYCIGCNNYRVFHDTQRDKMVFMPHGMDQLFGTSSSVGLSVTPPFKGLVAHALLTVPEARQRYLDRLRELSTNEFRNEALQQRVDHLAGQLRSSLAHDPGLLAQLDWAVQNLKARITQRVANVTQQLEHRGHPIVFAANGRTNLSGWSFKLGRNGTQGSRRLVDGEQILEISGSMPQSSGSWRTTVLLEPGHYVLSGSARTEGVPDSAGAGVKGVLLRISGERSTQGIALSEQWKDLRYEFDVTGLGEVELICEFRGQGSGLFRASSLQLARTSK